MLGIVDYGMGNTRSMLNALESIGQEAELVADPAALAAYPGLVLPGVGAFRDAMAALEERGLATAIVERVRGGVPLLGVCLGMQLLATRSFEFGEFEGLDLVPGEVRRIDTAPDLRIPHVGWNDVTVRRPGPLFEDAEEPTFYFVHSYELLPVEESDLSATTDYGRDLTAGVQRDGVFGVQFHPEKSQEDGLRLLRRFAALC